MRPRINRSYMDQPRIERLAKEIVSNGNLEQFSETVLAIVGRIVSTPNCKIACSYIDSTSSCNQSEDGSFIRIGMLSRPTEPVTLIWSILHEYGHHLSGTRSKNDLQKDREIIAWDFAFQEFLRYPELKGFQKSFEEYRAYCLSSYGVKF